MMSGRASILDSLPADGSLGAAMYALAARIYPLNRSITGNGVRATLSELQRLVPLAVHEVPTGTKVLDWTVPREWNIRGAYIADSGGRRIVDVADHNLHVVNYSVPVRARMTLAELQPHLHSLPGKPDLIPYVTSFYSDAWGFCLPHSLRTSLAEDTYEVVVDTTLADGSLTYGELLIEGESADEVLLHAHICHPSLANDNCSGLALLATLAHRLAARRNRLSYRVVFVPGTIGAITWLSRNRECAARVRHGLVLSNVGDGGGPNYKRSRRGNAAIDRAATLVLTGATASLRDFAPTGYDERQYCSPGFDLPVGLFQRSHFHEFPEYHTSADNLDFIKPEHLETSLRLIAGMLDIVDGDCVLRNTAPYGEPQLGRRGLYVGSDGLALTSEQRLAQAWVLNLADGHHSLLDMAERSGLPFSALRSAADRLDAAGLVVPDPQSAP